MKECTATWKFCTSDHCKTHISVPPSSLPIVPPIPCNVQGNRTPHTDALSRGALAGLTLAHSRGHVFRSLLEGVAMGTRLILDTMGAAGYRPSTINIAGGATRSELWLQIHADVAGVPFVLTAQPEAPMLGCAILASGGAVIQ
jgi:sugar (pentulose or hexulose) kinase